MNFPIPYLSHQHLFPIIDLIPPPSLPLLFQTATSWITSLWPFVLPPTSRYQLSWFGDLATLIEVVGPLIPCIHPDWLLVLEIAHFHQAPLNISVLAIARINKSINRPFSTCPPVIAGQLRISAPNWYLCSCASVFVTFEGLVFVCESLCCLLITSCVVEDRWNANTHS